MDPRDSRNVVARAWRRRERELDHLALLWRLDSLDLLDALDARLHLRRVARARLEALDEGLLLGEHRLLARELCCLSALGERALAFVEIVVAGVRGELAGIDLDDLADHPIQELTVVRRHHQRALKRAQEIL